MIDLLTDNDVYNAEHIARRTGRRLIALRNELRLKQTDVDSLTSVPQPAISKVENAGFHRGFLETSLTLAKFYKVHPAVLMFDPSLPLSQKAQEVASAWKQAAPDIRNEVLNLLGI